MHDDNEPCIAEEMLDRLIPALVRAGAIPADLLLELAEEMDREAETASVEREETLARMSTALLGWALMAAGPTQSEWQAERRRNRFNVVPMKPPE